MCCFIRRSASCLCVIGLVLFLAPTVSQAGEDWKAGISGTVAGHLEENHHHGFLRLTPFFQTGNWEARALLDKTVHEDSEFDNWSAGLTVDYTIELSERWTLMPGLHLSYLDYNNAYITSRLISPHLNLTYKHAPGQRTTAGFSVDHDVSSLEAQSYKGVGLAVGHQFASDPWSFNIGATLLWREHPKPFRVQELDVSANAMLGYHVTSNVQLQFSAILSEALEHVRTPLGPRKLEQEILDVKVAVETHLPDLPGKTSLTPYISYRMEQPNHQGQEDGFRLGLDVRVHF